METKYTTPEPMRWEQVAYKAYGDVYKMNLIIEANTDLTAFDVLPAGTEVVIPVLSVPETDDSLLPPWKRNT